MRAPASNAKIRKSRQMACNACGMMLLVAVAAAFCAHSGRAGESGQEFPDGVSARIKSVKAGGCFLHGAESAIENPVHSDGAPCGWRLFGGFSFEPAPEDRSLFVRFRISSLFDLWDAELIDEDGQAERKYCFDAIMGPVSLNAQIVGIRFPSFPRNQETMRIRLIRGGEWSRQKRSPSALEFVLPNPEPVARQPAESPHIVQQELEGTRVKLEAFRTGMLVGGPDGTGRQVSRVCFAAMDEDAPSRQWGVCVLRLEDSLGNSLDSYHASQVLKFDGRGKLEVPIFSPLWLAGNPWRIAAGFVRVDELPASQKTTIQELTVDPAARQPDRPTTRSFEIQAESSPAAIVRANYSTVCEQPGNILRIAVEFDTVPEGQHCGILEVKDDAGNPIQRIFGSNNTNPISWKNQPPAT